MTVAEDLVRVRDGLAAASSLHWRTRYLSEGERWLVMHETAGVQDFAVAECVSEPVAEFIAHSNHVLRDLGAQAHALHALTWEPGEEVEVAGLRHRARLVGPEGWSPWFRAGIGVDGRQGAASVDPESWSYDGPSYPHRQLRTEYQISALVSGIGAASWESRAGVGGDGGFVLVDGADGREVARGARPADGELVALATRVVPRMLAAVQAVEMLADEVEAAGGETVPARRLAEVMERAAGSAGVP